MTIIWQLLKEYVREFEIANQCEFGDEAWQRIKKLERDIEAEFTRRERERYEAARRYGNRGTDTEQY